MKKNKAKGKIVAEYDYPDADGNLLYQSCRTDPKDFFSRRPNGKGGYINNLDGVKRVLYHTPELTKSNPGEPVWVAEGEKDADRLIKQGKLATTNIGGAGKWRKEYSKQLRGRHVLIVPDNDKAGRDHAQKVAFALHKIAASVKVIELPDVRKKGDVSDWLDTGHTVEELDHLASTAPDWQPPKTEKQQGAKQKRGVKKKADEQVYSAVFDGLIDLALHEGRAVFLTKEGSDIIIKRAVLRDSITLVPPPADQIKWFLPRANEVIKYYEAWQADAATANTTLWHGLVQYHEGISELPDKRMYSVLAAWDIHTYLQELAQYSPELVLFAVAERGKTRTGKGITNIAYRGVRVTSMREAFVFRLAEHFHTTLFFDLRDAWKEAERNGCDDIILSRFERGSIVPRVLWPDKGAFKDTKYYDVFGPTIIATNRALDSILETRAITMTMRESGKTFRDEVLERDGQPLREQLVALRAYYLNQPFPDADKPVGGRLGDIMRPLRQIILAVQPEREQEFLELCRDLKRGVARDRADTIEGQVIAIIRGLEHEVVGGKLPVKLITTTFNADRQQRFQLTPQTIGRIVKALGFYDGHHRPKTDDGAAAIPWNDNLLKRLEVEYGIADSSDTPETPVFEENTDQSDVSDDQHKPPYSNTKQAPCLHSNWQPNELAPGQMICGNCMAVWDYPKKG